ncbi:MAG: hypothetical protein RIQ33_662, partial [Bacteroidota bacterium]
MQQNKFLATYICIIMLSTYITCFLVLTVLELVLGIDNIIFISIVSDRLPKAKKALGRNIGLALAMLLRIALLFAINWIVSLENPLIALFGFALSGKDLI